MNPSLQTQEKKRKLPRTGGWFWCPEREKDSQLSKDSIELAWDSIAMIKDTVEKDRDMEKLFLEAVNRQNALLDCMLLWGPQALLGPLQEPSHVLQSLGNRRYWEHKQMFTSVALLPEAIPLSAPSTGLQEKQRMQAQHIQTTQHIWQLCPNVWHRKAEGLEEAKIRSSPACEQAPPLLCAACSTTLCWISEFSLKLCFRLLCYKLDSCDYLLSFTFGACLLA